MNDESKFEKVTDNLHTNVKVKPQVDAWIMQALMKRKGEILNTFLAEVGCNPSEAILCLERTRKGFRIFLRRQRESDHIPEDHIKAIMAAKEPLVP